MLAVAVSIRVKPGRRDDVARVFELLTPPTRAEPGCLLFQAHADRDDEALVVVYEQWVDYAALEAHRATEHYRAYVPLLDGLIESRDRRLLDPLA